MKVYLLNRADVSVFQGDGRLKVFRDAGGEFVETGREDGERVQLRLIRCSEFSRDRWIIYVTFFCLLGIFGIFTPKYSPFVHRLECTVDFKEERGRSLKLRFAHFLGEGERVNLPAVTLAEGNALITDGRYVRDQAAERRRRLYSFFSRIGRLAAIVAASLLIVNSIV